MWPFEDSSRQPKTPRDGDTTDVPKKRELVVKGVKKFVHNLLESDCPQQEDDIPNPKSPPSRSKDIDDNSNKSSEGHSTISRQPTYQRIPVELCLIVPARLVSNLSRDQTLTRTEICHLIDNCAYFRCLPAKDLHSLEQDLQFTPEPMSPDSERDVYICIQIEDGEDMIDNSSCYGLKKRLPQTGGVIQKLALLANLSGRQHFNRI